MSKLTPPAMQNLQKRENFFKEHPEYKNSEKELERIKYIRECRKNLVSSKKVQKSDETYQNYRPTQYKVKKQGFLKKIFNMFNRGTK
jgi:hypothetical protein